MFDQFWNFLASNWKSIFFVFLVLYMIRCMATHKFCQNFVLAQIDWLKLFFTEDKLPNAPSHKNLIGIAAVTMFCIAFIKTLIYQTTPEVPDIPVGWQLVILGLLGIRSAQSAIEAFRKQAPPPPANGDTNEHQAG